MPTAKKLHPLIATKLPVQLATVADLLYQTREARYAQQKVVDALQAQETACCNHLINSLPKGKAGGITGAVASVEIYTEPTPKVDDWDKFYAYIIKHKAFELLTRALGKAAIKERWENKVAIPGVEKFNAVKVSITKKKR